MFKKYIVMEYTGEDVPDMKLPVPFDSHEEAFYYMLDRMSEYNGMTRPEMLEGLDVKAVDEAIFNFEDYYRSSVSLSCGQLYSRERTWRYWDIRTVSVDQDEITFNILEERDAPFLAM